VRRIPAQPVDGVDYLEYDLTQGPPDEAFRGARYLVHCAYVRHGDVPDSDRVNVEGAQALLALCRMWDVKPVFLSSFSAREGAGSHYGRTKLVIERLFDPARDLVLRPALVIGRGGLFGSMSRFIAGHRIVPIAGSGSQPLQVIAVEDLCLVVERGLRNGACGVFRIAHPEPVTLRAACEALAARRGRKPVFVPVPMWLLLALCRAAESLGIRLPVTSDSVLGLRQTAVEDTAADLAVFNLRPKEFADCLDSMDPSPAPSGRRETPDR